MATEGCDGMRAAAALLLLASLATSDGGDASDDVCVEAELRRVAITPDKLPVALLASTQLLGAEPWRDQTWDFDNWAREMLETHQDIQVTSENLYLQNNL